EDMERHKDARCMDSAPLSASCFSGCQRPKGRRRHPYGESMLAFGMSLAPSSRLEAMANTCRLHCQSWQNSCASEASETPASRSRARSKMLNRLSIENVKTSLGRAQ